MPPDDPAATPAAPAPAPESAPAVAAPAPESPAAAPAAEPQPATAPPAIEVPTAAPAAGEPPVEVPPEPATPEPEKPRLHTDTPTLMELAGKEEPGAEQPAPPAQPEPPAPRTYEPFTLPEGLALDGQSAAAANEIFAAHNLPQEAAQQLVDFHIAEMQRYDAAALQAQHDAFTGLRAEWVRQVMADPEIGGNGHHTAMASIAQMRDLFVSSAPQTSERYQQEMAEFNDFLRTTGAGDHPAFNRMLHNVARRFQEPAAPAITFAPPPDIGRRPNGAGTRRSILYGEVQGGTPNGQSR